MRSKAHWGYSKSFMEACKEELELTEEMLEEPGYSCFVAESESQIVGYYSLRKLNSEYYEMERLFVDPESIGKGIGKLLMNHAKDFVKEAGGVVIRVQSDPNAEKFYRSAGGIVIGTEASGSITGRSLPVLEIALK